MKIAQLYYECLQFGTSPIKWDTTLGVTHKHDVLWVYWWHVIFFDLFLLRWCLYICKTLLHCLIMYSYKTNPSFLPCPWNLRYIEPSEFNFLLKNLHIHIWYNLCTGHMMSTGASSHAFFGSTQKIRFRKIYDNYLTKKQGFVIQKIWGIFPQSVQYTPSILSNFIELIFTSTIYLTIVVAECF